MGLRINTNVAALNAHRNLTKQQKRNEHALSALASGSRIVQAADDAAGLAISENIRGQLGGIKQARNNAFNATSLVQIGEGGLTEITNIMVRLRELGVQAASDNIGETERQFLQTEAQQLVTEADRISKTTVFGSKKLLDGSGEQLEFHVGSFAGEDNIIRYNLNADARGETIGYAGITIGTREDARESLEKVDNALLAIGKLRADFGAVQSRLQTTVSNLDVQYENLNAANSRLRDADVAHESAEMVQSGVLQQAAIAVSAQANQRGLSALKLIS